MTLYILNSAVITTPGIYRYELIDKDLLKEYLKIYKDEIVNTIGYEETVNLFNEMFGTNFTVNRVQIKMNTRDKGIVFRIKERINIDEKGKISKDFIKDKLEIGLIEKLK